MGGCYSTDSDTAVTSPSHKLPTDRPSGHLEKRPQYSPLSNGDSQHEEEEALKQSITPVSARSTTGLQPEDVEKSKGVAPSDSGIESIGPPAEESNFDAQEKRETVLCRSYHNKLKRRSRDSCDQCGQFCLDTSELSLLLNGNTYSTGDSGQIGKESSCVMPGARSKACPPTYRHSDIPVRLLKSNLKKQGQEKRDSKHVRMSWKSTDSLDLNTAMTTCMDRPKSEASDVFGDDVSFRAPLAHFDSVDHQLDAENVEDEDGEKFFTSKMSIYSEILELADSICHCEFSDISSDDHHTKVFSVNEDQSVSGLKERQPPLSNLGHTHNNTDQLWSGSWREEEEEDSGRGLSKMESHFRSSSECDVEGAVVTDECSMTSSCSPFSHAAVNVLENLSSGCGEELSPVSVVVKGHQIVMMDARTYSHLLNDVRVLKQQLQRLLHALQGNEQGDDLVQKQDL